MGSPEKIEALGLPHQAAQSSYPVGKDVDLCGVGDTTDFDLLTKLSGGTGFVGSLQGRMRVARACGYMDARTMIFLYETYGLSIVDQAMQLHEFAPELQIDWSGLRCELKRIGKKSSSIDATLFEAREIMGKGALVGRLSGEESVDAIAAA